MTGLDDDPPPYFLLLAGDSVVVLIRHVDAGATFVGPEGSTWTMREPLETGSKLATRAITAGDQVIKLGMPIGTATKAIAPGELVHTHNLRSNFIAVELEGAEHGNGSAD
jgi:hypothetical protein